MGAEKNIKNCGERKISLPAEVRRAPRCRAAAAVFGAAFLGAVTLSGCEKATNYPPTTPVGKGAPVAEVENPKAEQNKQAIPELINALKMQDRKIVVEAAVALGKIGDPMAIPALTETLEKFKGGDAEIERAVMRSIEKIKLRNVNGQVMRMILGELQFYPNSDELPNLIMSKNPTYWICDPMALELELHVAIDKGARPKITDMRLRNIPNQPDFSALMKRINKYLEVHPFQKELANFEFDTLVTPVLSGCIPSSG